MDAVTALKDKNGSNQTSMTKYVESNLEPGLALPPAFKKHLADALQHLVDIGALVKVHDRTPALASPCASLLRRRAACAEGDGRGGARAQTGQNAPRV